MRHCPSSCSSGVDIDRVVRDAKRIFCNTPRTASMRRHDRLFADPNVKHVSQNNHLALLQLEKFVMFQARTYAREKLVHTSRRRMLSLLENCQKMSK